MGTADAEIKVPSAENPELLTDPSFQMGLIGRNIALCASFSVAFLNLCLLGSFTTPPPPPPPRFHPQCGTVDAEIKVSSVENPELTTVFPLKPGLGQIIALRNFLPVLISVTPLHSLFFSSFFSPNTQPTF